MLKLTIIIGTFLINSTFSCAGITFKFSSCFCSKVIVSAHYDFHFSDFCKSVINQLFCCGYGLPKNINNDKQG